MTAKAEPKVEPKATEQADPFATLAAEPVDNLFIGGGRPAKPVPASVMALVEKSYNGGGDAVKLRVPVADEATAKDLAKLLRKAGTQHEPVLTVRVTDEKDGDTVTALRFVAGPKVTRTAKPAETPAK